MPVTLTDEQAAALRTEREQWARDRQIADASTQIWNHKDFGDEAKALWKKAFPDTRIDGYDTEQRINARLDRERTEREEAERKAREKAADEEFATKRRAAQDKHRLTDDAMKSVEELMTERNIGDYDVAASYFVSQNPSPSEGTAEYDRHFWQHDKSPEYREVATDPEGYARKEIMRAIRTDAQRGNR